MTPEGTWYAMPLWTAKKQHYFGPPFPVKYSHRLMRKSLCGRVERATFMFATKTEPKCKTCLRVLEKHADVPS